MCTERELLKQLLGEDGDAKLLNSALDQVFQPTCRLIKYTQNGGECFQGSHLRHRQGLRDASAQ